MSLASEGCCTPSPEAGTPLGGRRAPRQGSAEAGPGQPRQRSRPLSLPLPAWLPALGNPWDAKGT